MDKENAYSSQELGEFKNIVARLQANPVDQPKREILNNRNIISKMVT